MLHGNGFIDLNVSLPPMNKEDPDKTIWKDIINSFHGENTEVRRDSLEALSLKYLKLSQRFYLKTGSSVEEASELAQGFFTREVKKEFSTFSRADPERGLRVYLFKALSNYRIDERRKQQSQARGGNAEKIRHEDLSDEDELSQPSESGQIWDSMWTWDILEKSWDRLIQNARPGLTPQLLALCKTYLLDPSSTLTHAEIRSQLDISAATLSRKIEHLKARLRDYIRQEVAVGLNSQPALEEELRFFSENWGEFKKNAK